jgi:hypothetical protein
MEYFKPYSYLFKRTSGTISLKSCSVVLIPAGKKITLRSGDPDTDGNLTLIRYAVENDNSQFNARQEDLIHQFAWDGNAHSVQVVIGEGSGDEGGTNIIESSDAELE